MCLERNPLDLLPHAPDLVRELATLVTGNRGSDDGAADTAGTAERDLRRDVDVRDWLRHKLAKKSSTRGMWRGILTVLVLAEDGKVEDDSEGSRVSGKDHKLRDTTVERLGRLVGALLQLAGICKRVVRSGRSNGGEEILRWQDWTRSRISCSRAASARGQAVLHVSFARCQVRSRADDGTHTGTVLISHCDGYWVLRLKVRLFVSKRS